MFFWSKAKYIVAVTVTSTNQKTDNRSKAGSTNPKIKSNIQRLDKSWENRSKVTILDLKLN